MSERLRAAIEELVEKISERTLELASLKKTVNMLCRESGEQARYPAEEEDARPSGAAIRPDQFYGKSVISAAREYLEPRRRACPAEEILTALERGGFDFDAQGWKTGRLRSLAIALSKNTAIFHRLPNGTYGLRAWYQNLPKKTVGRAGRVEGDPADGPESASSGEEAE